MFAGTSHQKEQQELLQEIIELKQQILTRAFKQLTNQKLIYNDTQIADAIEQFVARQKIKAVTSSTEYNGAEQQYKDKDGTEYYFLVQQSINGAIFEVLGARYNKVKRDVAQQYDPEGIRFKTNQDNTVNSNIITTINFSVDDSQQFNTTEVMFDDVSYLLNLMLEDATNKSESVQQLIHNQFAPFIGSKESHPIRLKFVWIDKYTLAMFFYVEQHDQVGKLEINFVECKTITSKPDNNKQLTEDELKLILIDELLALMYN